MGRLFNFVNQIDKINMDIEELNSVLVAIVEKRMELSRLNYADQEYDVIEEELHELEDVLVDQFGNDLEKILTEIHQKYCPDTEVLSPIAYLAKVYHNLGKRKDGSAQYDISNLSQGVVIDSDDYAQAYLVIIPNPIHIVLTAPKEKVKQLVWSAEN